MKSERRNEGKVPTVTNINRMRQNLIKEGVLKQVAHSLGTTSALAASANKSHRANSGNHGSAWSHAADGSASVKQTHKKSSLVASSRSCGKEGGVEPHGGSIGSGGSGGSGGGFGESRLEGRTPRNASSKCDGKKISLN